MSERDLRRVSNNINFYPRRGATAQTPHGASRPAHAHIRTVLQVSVFSSVQYFTVLQFRAEQDTDGNGRMARLPLLGGAPPVDLLRLDARRNCRRKHPDALADQTRAVAGDPV